MFFRGVWGGGREEEMGGEVWGLCVPILAPIDPQLIKSPHCPPNLGSLHPKSPQFWLPLTPIPFNPIDVPIFGVSVPPNPQIWGLCVPILAPIDPQLIKSPPCPPHLGSLYPTPPILAPIDPHLIESPHCPPNLGSLHPTPPNFDSH